MFLPQPLATQQHLRSPATSTRCCREWCQFPDDDNYHGFDVLMVEMTIFCWDEINQKIHNIEELHFEIYFLGKEDFPWRRLFH